MRPTLPIVAVLLAGVTLASVTGTQLETMSAEREPASPLLYLPNGKYLQVASLGQAPLVADALYLWAIQFYANYDRGDRYRYVEHVFNEVIAELDPNFIDAYWLGALILSVEARDLEAGLRLLDKGIRNNPDAWVLPYLAGWECHYNKRYDLAAEYFRKASAIPGAPPMVRRMVGGMESRAGNVDAALAEWRGILEDPETDPDSRAIAARQVRDLTVRSDLAILGTMIDQFRERNTRWPAGLGELVAGGYLPEVPLDPDGVEYRYDPQSGKVSSSASRLLGDR